MRWPWTRPKPPDIPPFVPETVRPAHISVRQQHIPKDEGIVVEEVDTRSMTETGIFKAWKRMTGQG